MTQSLSHHFGSLEEFVAFPHGWDVDFRPTSGQLGPVLLHQTSTDNLVINQGEFPGSTLQYGATPEGMRTFALALGKGPDILWHGRKVSGNDLMVFNPGGDLHAVTRPGAKICTFSIANTIIDQYLARQDCSENPLPQESLVLKVGQEATKKLIRHSVQLGRCISLSSNHEQTHKLSQQLEESLSDALLANLLPHNANTDYVTPHRAGLITRNAVDYIETQKRRLLRVSQICDALGVGQRTLELSFKKHLGISPKQYLASTRLLGCQQDLLAAEPERSSVNQIAAEWGYWHMSQFAGDYQRLCGELPSQALKRQRDTSAVSPL